MLPYIGTRNAARDMDVLRAALGDSKLTYLGKSYGTYLGTWYAQLFPSHVRALVLDGAVDPEGSGLSMDIVQGQGFQVALRSFTADCLTRADCPLGHGSVGAAVARIQSLVDQANRRPLTNNLDNQPADGAMLLNGIATALYSQTYWPALREGLADAFGGDGTVLVELANALYERKANGQYSNLADADIAVSCLDRPWPTALAAWRSAAAAAAKAAPLFGQPITWGNLPCAYWPVRSYPLTPIRAAGAPTDPGGRQQARSSHPLPVGPGTGRGPEVRGAARLERQRPHRLHDGQLLRGQRGQQLPDLADRAA